MRPTVTVLDVLAFFLVVWGVGLVFHQVNNDVRWAERSSNVARGIPPPEEKAYARWLMRGHGEQALSELGAQAGNLAAGIPKRQLGAKIALIGAILLLVAAVLPLWWS
jgi:hypothetical protein